MGQNVNLLPNLNARGRGAINAPKSRFDCQDRQWFDDGWTIEENAQVLRTEITEEPAKALFRTLHRLTFLLIALSMPIGGVNMGVCIVMHGPVTIIWISPLG